MDLLKRKLDYHYKYFDRKHISPDPLEFLHKYKNPLDIELIGFISSVFAYGNVKQIIATLSKLEEKMEHCPYEFIMNYHSQRDYSLFNDIKHRFYTSADIASLFEMLSRVYRNYPSLKTLFLLYYFEEEKNLKSSISFFSKNLLSLCSKCSSNNRSSGIKFMFSDPLQGSACKRMNLFLRWMVRHDELDFGLWFEIPPSKLVIPVDVHVAKICRQLKLTRIKNVSWNMAEDITEKLRKYDPLDPVKYDFAICHIGMRKMEF